MELDINKFLFPDKKLFWFKLWLKMALITRRQIVILFPVHGLDQFPADPSIKIFKQASSEHYNKIRKELEKHFIFECFYFDSRDMEISNPRFMLHIENLDKKSLEAFIAHKAKRDSYIITLGFKCIITGVKLLPD